MPTNVTIEYSKAEARYRAAKTKEEKMAALEEMLSALPKHKGTEHVQAEIRAKIAKLRTQKEAKAARKTLSVPREGEAQVVIIGTVNSGKSTLLNALTGTKADVAPYEYTTTMPQVGVALINDVPIQIVEIPSTFTPEVLSIARNADLALLLIDARKDRLEQVMFLAELVEKRLGNLVHVWIDNDADLVTIKNKVWASLGRIRIYTKTPGKPKDLPAITFAEGATVADVAKRIHKDFLRKFRFARIYGPSARFAGQQVGLEHPVRDGDVVEIHID